MIADAAEWAVKSLVFDPLEWLAGRLSRPALSTPDPRYPMIRVSGRSIRHATTRVDTSTDGVTIRIDDVSNPEMWIELTIPHGDLCRMIDDVNAHFDPLPMPVDVPAPLDPPDAIPPAPSAR